MSRYTRNEFNIDSKATIGIDFGIRWIQIDSKVVKVQVWDTAGQERCRALVGAYYRGAVGAFLVYDITNRDTYDGIKKWLDELKRRGEPDVTIMLVGNKSDLKDDRAVPTEEAEALAAERGWLFMETSALDSSNVDTAFLDILTGAYQIASSKMERDKAAVNVNTHPFSGGKCC
ncbi:hypothetical protein TWF718_002262 [Orbilia javanica]|uniref:Uncharacterized protein n=1 Tax=Orbilia javanica TaxID=47235 RepID=A0AAN8MN47_9PEZI